jgi:phytoene dehydrogenase-like protein
MGMALSPSSYDAIVIGAGHNGLVTTCYLAGSLMMGPDAERTRDEIAKFSERDAERYPEYEAMLERVAAVVEPTLTMAPPDLQRPRLGDLRTLFSLGRSSRRLGDGAGEAVEILSGAARPILDRWFESES